MKKLITTVLLPLVFTAASFGQDSLIIRGFVRGQTKGYNKVYVFGSSTKTDSTDITDGQFEIRIPYVKGMVPQLYSDYSLKVLGYAHAIPAYVDRPGVLYLKDADINSGLNSGIWSGIGSAADFQLFEKGFSEIADQITQILQAKYPQKNKRDSIFRTEYAAMLKVKGAPFILEFMKQHPDSYGAICALQARRELLTETELSTALKVISPANLNSEPGRKLDHFLAGLHKSATGRIIENFILPTNNDQSFSYDSLKGKYVLIDFWASWCGPCKASFPHMKEVYNKYKGEHFEILSISIDEEKQAWIKELAKQQLPWPQVLDTKNINQTGFAVTGVPTTYLVSPKGEILLKEVGFDKAGNSVIEARLKSLFDKKEGY